MNTSPKGSHPPVPLVLIAGFLGAGKTTLLRELLPRLRAVGIVPHVLLNDHVNAWIDGQTLEGLAKTVVPISGSCVCCDAREDLLSALTTLTLPPRSVVLVEANGSSDTESLLEMLALERQARLFTLPLQIGVVDAKRWQKRWWNNPLERAQAVTSNLLFLTRSGEVGATRLAEVCADVKACAPQAEWTDPDGLCARIESLVSGAGVLPPRRFFARFGEERPGHQRHHFASLELALPPVIPRAALEAFLRELPALVLRAKGVAVLAGAPPERVHFQKVEGAGDPFIVPLDDSCDLEPVAVIVAPRLPAEHITQLADRHFAAAPPISSPRS